MRVDWTSQDGQIDPFWTLWMTSVIDSEEETIFTNRITAGSASRVRNATRLIYQPQRRSSKLREFHLCRIGRELIQVTAISLATPNSKDGSGKQMANLSPQGRHTGSHSYRLYRLRPTAAAASKSAIRSSCEP